MARRSWTRDELILAMNLYCQLPFGRFHKGAPEVIRLASAIDRTPSSVAMKLSNLASLDPAHLDRGVKGLSGASQADRQVWREFHDDWERLSSESEALRERYNLVSEEGREEVFSDAGEFTGATDRPLTVAARCAQGFFRRSVLASYENRCCVSEVNLPQLLIASHILPWSKFPGQRVDPRNGLCLSRLHDAAFDQGLITFDEDFRLVLSSSLKEATTNSVLRTAFHGYEGHAMRQSHRFRPRSQYFEWHRTECFQG